MRHDEHEHGHEHGHEHEHGDEHARHEADDSDHAHGHTDAPAAVAAADDDHGHAHEHKHKKKEHKHKGEAHEHQHKAHKKGKGKPHKQEGGEGAALLADYDEHHGHGHHEGQRDSNRMETHEDHNMRAIFLHFLGDAISSLFVVATALLLYFFPYQAATPTSAAVNAWVVYADPSASILVVGVVLYTTIPLTLRVASILLQRAPVVLVARAVALGGLALTLPGRRAPRFRS